MIEYGEEICRDPARAGAREWLETNGKGGFASSTVCGMNTRRYHGLLVAAPDPPAGRILLLAKLEETLVLGGGRFELGANRYPGVIHPRGFEFLRSFRLDPFPVFNWTIEGVAIEKRVFLVQGENTVVVRYAISDDSAALELAPLIAFRDYHAITHENVSLDPTCDTGPGVVSFLPYEGLPRLYLAHDASEVRPAGWWYRNLEYERERERGLEWREDLFNPVVLAFRGPRATVIAGLNRRDASEAKSLEAAERTRRSEVGAAVPAPGAAARTLAGAAEQFLVERGARKSVIAGYPWFTDWGRDTMIALPGLLLSRGRGNDARAVLESFAHAVDRGMIPNRFADAGDVAEYNAADATLWYFHAAWANAATSREPVSDELYYLLAGIVLWHIHGTRYGIRMDADGLLLAGDGGTQLTWMDARAAGRPVTPRNGKPVEVQALWYNALRVMEKLAAARNDRVAARGYARFGEDARASFVPRFWNQEGGCLYDVVDGLRSDPSIRPNQIFAVSLPHPIVEGRHARQVFDVVRRELLTPYGLRTLSPSDPRYAARFDGGAAARDAAYHQGTVWPWLMGPFIDAWLRLEGNSEAARRQAQEWLDPLCRFLEDEGCGQLPEVFDGDPPHRPGGTIAQAWSVAEVLRALAAVAA